MYDCPQCGEPSNDFVEGYCRACHDERQRQLDEHNARYDFWQKCSPAERERYIKSALR
jgi:hypothetical protein